MIGLLALLAVSGCAGRKGVVPTSTLSAEAMYRQAMTLLEQRSLRKARTVLERIGGQYTQKNRTVLEPLVRLALADVSFYEGTDLALIDSRALYLDFVTLYADHPLAPYAQLQAGVCSLRQASHPARDQSETLRAIADLRDVVRRYPDSKYARAARDKIDEAEMLLAEHEFLVGAFYLAKKKYQAAAQRFKTIIEQYPRYPEKEKLFFHLGQSLVLAADNVEGKVYLDRLLADYPDSEWAGRARKLLPRAAGEQQADGNAGS